MNFNGENLQEVLKAHKLWLKGEECGSPADLRGADLQEANLQWADLQEANLQEANLRGADLHGADLQGAGLQGAYLRGAKNVPFIPMMCPDTGSFIGWKKSKTESDLDVIVKLLIPDDAKRSSATTRKCRASKAIVLEIQTLDGKPLENVIAHSKHAINFVYKVGETVTPKLPFDEDRFNECASGIHFFINRQEAVDF